MSTSRIDALYAVPLEDFTKERKRAAAEAKSKPERAEILAIPKPTRAAWTINRLARERRKEVEALFAGGDALKHAQGKGERARIQESTRVLRVRLAEITKLSRALGANATTLHRIAATLQSALVDDEVRALVLASRLAHDVEVEGFGALAGTKVAAPRAARPTKDNARQEDAARKREEARARARQEREEREALERRRAIARREHEKAVGDARLEVARAAKELAAAKAKLRALRARKPT